MTRRVLLAVVAALLLGFIALPLSLLVFGAGNLSLAFGEGEAIVNTVKLSFGTAAIALCGGLPVGFG